MINVIGDYFGAKALVDIDCNAANVTSPDNADRLLVQFLRNLWGPAEVATFKLVEVLLSPPQQVHQLRNGKFRDGCW